jgi:uncharacterized protein YbjT (DUF2867 family)
LHSFWLHWLCGVLRQWSDCVPERVLVTGGTGTLGRLIVPRLRSAGCEVRVASRRSADVQLDLATGAGLAGAVAGCETIVHLATGVRGLYRAIHAVDVLGTQQLLEHAGRAGVRHFLYISIVGVDRIPFAYYRAKLQAERLIQRQTAVNWSILRATQFHDLVNLYFRTLRWLPALLIPKATPCQPVDAGEVADRLCALVLGGPAGRLPDFGGPQVLGADELAQAWLAATNLRRAIVALPLPGRVAAGFRAGFHTTPEHCDGHVSWQDWLTRTYPGR